MTQAVITKALNQLMNNIELGKTNSAYDWSLGYHRLSVLPCRVKRNYDLAANLQTNWDGKKAFDNQIDFLGGLTDQEFINWMRLA